MSTLGKALFIVNPASQNGKAAQGAAAIRFFAHQYPDMADSVEIVSTSCPGHASEIARNASESDSVIALGGDGLIHEIIAGLMEIPDALRPAFGLIPCGNGNDYARTLGMSTDFESAFAQLCNARIQNADVGVCNGEYFVQTLSFGLDAAIAIGTHERRKRTGLEGTQLFLREGIDQLLHHRDIYTAHVVFDDEYPLVYEMHLMAVQIGPTYGGGFKICPDADFSDGICDTCIARAPLGFAAAARLFLKAKEGKHTSYTKTLSFNQAKHICIDFDREPPIQIDGERCSGTHFEISVIPQKLRVLVP